MKTKFFFVCLLAGTLVSCDFDALAENAHRYFSRYTYLTFGIVSAVEQAYCDSTADFNGSWLMTKGPLSGDSLHISHPMEKTFVLTSNSSLSSLSLTAELLGQEEWDNGIIESEKNMLKISGSGTYRISQDSLFSYEINDIAGEFYYHVTKESGEAFVDFVYGNGGEIALSLQTSEKTQTYHYELHSGNIRCRETNSIVLSHDE